MTDQTRPDDLMPEEGSPKVAARREASMTLRGGGPGSDDEIQMFDPANQSAAEALRISYHLLLVGIGVLVLLFLLSGFKTVEEGKVGVRLFAGRITGRNLEPGMRWSAPQPLGEILTFHRNPPVIEIRAAFYPQRGSDPTSSLETLARTAGTRLDPSMDGSLITGDLNLAHAQWVVQYRREDVDKLAERIYPDAEADLMRMAVQRGAVHAVAGARLDDVIKPAGQSEVNVAERARLYAQAMLDELESGLRIQSLDMQRATVPLGIYQEWAELAGQDAAAAKKIDEARSQAQQIRNATAGAAAPQLLELIDRYERAVELEDVPAQELALSKIDALFEGESVEIDGENVTALVSGRVTTMLNDARQYRSTVASRERARLSKFRSILEQFRSNPTVVVHREWADAYREFRAKPFVQLVQAPYGANLLELLVNQDPDIVREQSMERRRIETERARERRLQQARDEQFKPANEQIYSAEPDG